MIDQDVQTLDTSTAYNVVTEQSAEPAILIPQDNADRLPMLPNPAINIQPRVVSVFPAIYRSPFLDLPDGNGLTVFLGLSTLLLVAGLVFPAVPAPAFPPGRILWMIVASFTLCRIPAAALVALGTYTAIP